MSSDEVAMLEYRPEPLPLKIGSVRAAEDVATLCAKQVPGYRPIYQPDPMLKRTVPMGP
jgi:hypothetical protein